MPPLRLQVVTTALSSLLLLCVSGVLCHHESDSSGMLGCYVCSSVNNSNPDCEDEFDAIPSFFISNCMAARKSYDNGKNSMPISVRVGLYPAKWCIKFKATDKVTGETHMIRDCAADSGGTTYDTEIGGMSHCGVLMKDVRYNGRQMVGCIMTCRTDGCNSGLSVTRHGFSDSSFLLIIISLITAKL